MRKTVRRVQLADGRTCVVKHGTEVRREEGEVMRYVRATTSVRLPEVSLAPFHSPSSFARAPAALARCTCRVRTRCKPA